MFDLLSFAEHTVCVQPNGTSHTYVELSSLSQTVGKYMSAHSLVFCLCENSFESLLGYVACVQNGNPILLLDAHLEPSALVALQETYRPQYLWHPVDRADSVGESIYHIGHYQLTQTANVLKQPLPDSLSVLLTTSGSTGSPKLVRLSRENILSNARSIAEYLHITADERPVTGLPMYYSFGLSIINSHLLKGATLLMTNDSYVQKEFWDFANRERFTSFSGIPYTFEILKRLRFWSMDCPTLKTLTQAGGKLSNELLQFFIENGSKKGVDFYLMYGQTEATARMSYLPPAYALSKLGSIGKGIPGGKFSLADDDGDEITVPNEVGELVYTGDNVSLGYAESLSDLYKPDENHGVLHTGDLAYRDDDGFYFIAGRKKRFLKLFGNRVSLDYIETLLKAYLQECVCVGNDSRLIIYTTDTVYNASEVVDFLVQRTKILRSSFLIRHIDRIPRSETGKIMYKELPIE